MGREGGRGMEEHAYVHTQRRRSLRTVGHVLGEASLTAAAIVCNRQIKALRHLGNSGMNVFAQEYGGPRIHVYMTCTCAHATHRDQTDVDGCSERASERDRW
jgi:hypothetical protein